MYVGVIGHRGVVYLDQILIGRPWVRDSVRYSLIHLEDSNLLLMHLNSTYLSSIVCWILWWWIYCKFLSNTCPFPVWFVLISLCFHRPFNCCNIIRILCLNIIWHSNSNRKRVGLLHKNLQQIRFYHVYST